MTTNAELAARLLRECAGVFRALGESNEQYKSEMDEFVLTCMYVADEVETNPQGIAGHSDEE